MKKARYQSIIVILIILASLISWPQGQAITPQNQTISIIETHDDKFITESGVGIDTYLCHIMDPTMDIVSYLVFRGLEINGWEPLTNATLRFRTTVNLDFEADSSVTIYGMKVSDLQDEGHLSNAWIMSVPKTSAYVNVNTSQFYGQQWHEVNVTNIVQELKSHIHWDGHGRSGDETGDDIGFVIHGAEGHDTRWFIDYHYGTPDLATQLVIHWNHKFSPPSGIPPSATFNETLGNWTIWYCAGYEILTEEYYNWQNPRSLISLQNVYLLSLVNFSWTGYGWPISYNHHELSRIERFDNYTDSIEFRWYMKLVQEYSITHRPDWNIVNVSNYDPTGNVIPFQHYIEPGDSAGSHQLHVSYGGATYTGISYNNSGDVWWNRYHLNKTYITFSAWTGETEPDWDVDLPTKTWTSSALSIYNHDQKNYSKTFVIAQSVKGSSLYTGRTDMLMGYVSVVIDDIPVSDEDWWAYDQTNNETYGPFDDYDDVVDFIETEDPDPEDPDPGGEWSTGPGGETGAFTRFRMRLWFMLIGFGCLFGPILFFAWRRPSGYYILCGAILMLIGIGMLLSIGQV